MARYAKRRVTITDVAELAGVSIATVSKVLNGKDEHISAETREMVQDAVKELGYVPNDMARCLKDQNSKTIGLMLPDISNAFPEMAQGAQDEAFVREYTMFFCSTGSNPIQEEKMLKTLISKMVDGIIYVSSNYETSGRLLTSLPVPCVAIDRQVPKNTNIGVVSIDNYQAMYDVAGLVASRGCRKVGYITADIAESPSKERCQGLLDGLKAHGISFDRRLLYSGVFGVETGYMGAMTLLEREPDIDCIICGNDLIAIGTMNVCQKMQKSIPSDVKIVGFDDIFISRYLNPELTTVKQDAYRMGKCAAQMLIEHVEEEKPLSKIVLPYEIVLRGTI